ncbi:MAG: 6-phosphogluconolactonase [Bacteroidetes bacterium]|nr:6-phosphogluconolactonase [Bacteroidota bacterium]
MKKMNLNRQNNINVFKTAAALAYATADLIVEISKQAVESRGKFIISLSGGTTPEYLYTLLAKPPYRDQIPWNKTFIFWGDERFVPSNNKLNNANMAKALLLDQINIPTINIYPIPVDLEPEKAAKEYASRISKFFGKDTPRFDLIFLGLGENGHTASLFPGSDVVFENTQLVREVFVAEQHMFRITMTPPLINKAHNIVFLVEGENKAEILKTVLSGPQQPDKYPAQVINAEDGNLYWFVDKKAAALLPTNIGKEHCVKLSAPANILSLLKREGKMDLLKKYKEVRKYSEDICKPLKTEDYVVQPVVDVSPPKWHIGHVTWFFETLILKEFAKDYVEFNPQYNYVFNSYYETIGARVIRTNRGNLSRPTVDDIYAYRKYVDGAMINFLQEDISKDVEKILVLGFNHEQQHQELLLTDIKYILGNNPLFPAYKNSTDEKIKKEVSQIGSFINIEKGVYEIGFEGDGFCYDNELNRHPVYLVDFRIATSLVTNGEFLEFINAGGYKDFNYWYSDGWNWVKTRQFEAPLYWHFIEGKWYNYTLAGLVPVNMDEPVCHVSFYEATAYATWKGMRLPTEFEWEIAAKQFDWGRRWEWTNSAYLPYPGFSKAPGAIGEYNGKFMVNQMVLRGASDATPLGHSRITYRNFFQPELRWQYTGIRLAQ